MISAYCELKASNKLAANNLNYSQQFFTALRGLRFVGWSPQSQDQVDFGKDIANELKGNVSSNADCGPDPTGSSDRVFYSVSFFDGINTKFLSKWLANGKTGVRDAVRASAGEIHYTFGGTNKFVDKVGISNTETIKPWDPAKQKPDIPEVPTLILKGSADTVPVGGASEYIFLNALAGPRTLIEFPGIGHFYILPSIPSNFSSTSPACSPSRSIRNCLIYSFLIMSSTDFKNPTINGILPVTTNLGTDPSTGAILTPAFATETRV